MNVALPTHVKHLVIGGGPAGSMAGLSLAAAGEDVLLIEKEHEPHHKVCGEFLSREALHYLAQAGIDPVALGALRIARLRLSDAHRIVESEIPFPAFSLSRRVLDAALLERTKQAGCRVALGLVVESLRSENSEWTAQLSDGSTLRAQHVFLATGKHDLRGMQRPPGRQPDLIGFKMHWQLRGTSSDALRKVMNLFLFPGGYGGIALVETGAANLCFVVRRQMLRKLGEWQSLVKWICTHNEHLAQLLDGAEPLLTKPMAISPIPYGYLGPRDTTVWRVGDQAAVIPSFTGDGVSIAMHTGSLAASACLSGDSIKSYNDAVVRQLRDAMHLATTLSRFAVTRTGHRMILPALRFAPWLMPRVAASTRIPQQHLSTIAS